MLPPGPLIRFVLEPEFPSTPRLLIVIEPVFTNEVTGIGPFNVMDPVAVLVPPFQVALPMVKAPLPVTLFKVWPLRISDVSAPKVVLVKLVTALTSCKPAPCSWPPMILGAR